MDNIDQFVKAVSEMRDLQRRYFKAAARSRSTSFPDHINEKKKILELSKAKEKEVDEMLENLKQGSLNQQSKLFQ